MSRFVASMDNANAVATLCTDVQFGENGTLEFTAEGVGDARVALSFALVRNIPKNRIEELMGSVLDQVNDAKTPEKASIVADLFLLAFQTRDCRGGKGEKAIFDEMIMNLYKHYPRTVISCLHLIPKYGSFKDLFRLLDVTANYWIDLPKFIPFKKRILAIVTKQLQLDEKIVNDVEKSNVLGEEKKIPKISLCAKYCPREGKKFSKCDWMDELRNNLFPANLSINSKKKMYRKLVTKLTVALDVVEVKMNSHRYREIEFSKVPSLCLNRNRKAFANELLATRYLNGKKSKAVKNANVMDETTGNRFVTDEDRIACRANFVATLRETGASGVNGKQLEPHSLVQQIAKGRNKLSALELELFNAQWTAIRDNLEKVLLEKTLNAATSALASTDLAAPSSNTENPPIDFRKLVPLVDVSGSMEGDPMYAAIALGILTSEVNHPLFRNRFITFESEPRWIDLSDCTTLAEKVKKTKEAPWGGSTNIDKAFDLILQIVETNKLPINEVPDLIVFSDMQFDSACETKCETQLENIQKRFHAVGIKVCGKPYATPRIVFWNLRGDTSGFPAKADTPNVQMLSGFSPALLKLALSGEPVAAKKKETTSTTDRPNAPEVNPYDTFRKMLDDERYDIVRKVLNFSQEKHLSEYKFDLNGQMKTDLTTTDAAADTTTSEKTKKSKTPQHRKKDVELDDDNSSAMIVEDFPDEDFDWELIMK